MQTVIRDEQDNITHVYWCTNGLGIKYFVTKDDLLLLQGLDHVDVLEFYFNKDKEDILTDLSDLFTNTISVEYLKLKMGLQLGYIGIDSLIKK